VPRFLRPAPQVDQMAGAVFSRLAHKIASIEGPVFPLHVGDTWLPPFDDGRMENLRYDDWQGIHKYTSPQGMPVLVDAIVDKVRADNALHAERDSVLVTAGTTGGLSSAVGMLAAPGEEVLILAPHWPLIRGIVESFRAVPVLVPFYDRVDSVEAAVEAVRERLSRRTVALYVSTPSNPTGVVLPPTWLQALAELCRDQDLWLLSDEVYEHHAYRGEHASIGSFAPERTLSAFSFSKAYGMAGNRTGYLVGPPEAIANCRKISTHTFYSAPTSGQIAGLKALQGGDAWLAESRRVYQQAGDEAARVLGEPPPRGSTFLFLDVAEHLDERGIFGFLEDCLEDGLVMAPGPSFGRGHYDTHVRLCYTSAPPEHVAEGCRRLARRLGR
jgi:aspartate/methionine/tyrosine aminotransferase